MSIQEQLLQAFDQGTINKMTVSEICRVFAIPDREKKRLTSVLDSLVENGSIYQDNGGRYGTAEALGLIKGKINGNERGFAFWFPKIAANMKTTTFYPEKIYTARCMATLF